MRSFRYLVIGVAAACAACEEGGDLTFRRAQSSPTPTATPGAFDLLETTPQHQAIGVDLSASLTATFSATVDASTASGSFLVHIGGAEVEGSVAVSASSASFVPAAPFRYLADYEATLLQGIASVDGLALDEQHAWSFRTRDLAWSEPAPLEMEGGGVGTTTPPAVAATPSGAAWAVWPQDEGTVDNLFAATFTRGLGWSPPELIEQLATTALFSAVVADLGGNALAVWVQGGDMRANRFTSGVGWGSSEVIDASTGGFSITDRGNTLGIDTSGNAVTAWSQTDGTRYNIWANRYQIGSGWGTALLIENDNAGFALAPQVAVAPDGSATVVWAQSDGVADNIVAARYVPGVGWGAPQTLDSIAGNANFPAVAADNERVIAAWVQHDGIAFNAYSSVFVDSLGWSAPQPIEQLEDDSAALRLAMASDGVAFACWSQRGATSQAIIANRYTPGSGWETAIPLETGAGLADDCDLTTDATGQATVVWRRDNRLGRARFLPPVGWETAETFEDAGALFDIASSSDGGTFVIWTAAGDLLGSQFE